VQGSAVTANGHIDGSLTTYDYKALYQVYTLKESESANYWFLSYSKDTFDQGVCGKERAQPGVSGLGLLNSLRLTIDIILVIGHCR